MKNTNRQIPGFIRFLLGIISFALCICLLLTTVVTVLVADVGLLTSKVGLQQVIKDLLFSAPAERPVYAPAGMTLGGYNVRLDDSTLTTGGDMSMGNLGDLGNLDLGNIDLGDINFEDILSGESNLSDVLADVVYEAVASQSPEEVPFTKEDIQEFMEESTIPEFLSDKVAGLVSDTLLGEESTSITVEEVMTVIQENKDLIEDTFQIEIPEEAVTEIENVLNETFTEGDIASTIRTEINKGMGLLDPVAPMPGAPAPDSPEHGTNGDAAIDKGPLASIPDENFQNGLDLILALLSGQSIVLGAPQAITLLRFVTSAPVLIALIAACLLLIGLLFLTNWGRPGSAMVWAGVPVFIAGGLTSLPAALGDALATLLPVNISPIANLLSYISTGVTVFGLVLIVVGIIIGSNMKKARRKAAAGEPCCEHITINPTAAVEPFCEITEDPVVEIAEEIEEEEEVCTEETSEEDAEEETEETAEV